MNISNDTAVFHDCGIGHLMSSSAQTAFILEVSYTVLVIDFLSPIEHR